MSTLLITFHTFLLCLGFFFFFLGLVFFVLFCFVLFCFVLFCFVLFCFAFVLLSFSPTAHLLYSFHMESLIATDPDTKIKYAERMCDGLASVLLSLKKKPLIRYQGNSKKCQALAQGSMFYIKKRASQKRVFNFSL